MASTTGVVPETPAREPDDGTTDGSLTELAALEAARDEKRRLLEQRRRAPPSPSSARSADYPAGCTADDLPGAAAALLLERAGRRGARARAARARRPGARPPDGWPGPAARARRPSTSQRSGDGGAVIRLVTDDMPYLVDSVTAEVVRQGVDLAHVVHPVRRGPPRRRAAGSWPSATAPTARGLRPRRARRVVDGGRARRPAGRGGRRRPGHRPAHRARRRPRRPRGRRAAAGPAAGPRRPSSRRCAGERRAGRRAPIPRTTRRRPRRCCAGWPTATSSSWAPATSTSRRARQARPSGPCPAAGWGCCAATPT